MQTVLHSMASLSRTGRTQGHRKKSNQDASFAFRQYVEDHQAIAGVMDGHGPNGAIRLEVRAEDAAGSDCQGAGRQG